MPRNLVMFGDRRLPFGVLVKNDHPREPYYGDGQYHATVLWPRSLPYLIRLLEMTRDLDDRLMIGDLLVNTLDHQMSEGAVFYTHELFSLPLGNNPSGHSRREVVR